MSPSSPESAISFSLATPGWYWSRWPTISTRPLSSAAATARSASATDCASGFSTKQCLPARSTRSASARVGGHRGGEHDGVELGVAEQVVELGGEARRRERARVALARDASEASQHQVSSQPGREAKLRARFGPQ